MHWPNVIQNVKMNSLLEHGVGNRSALPQVLLQLREEVWVGNDGQNVILIACQVFNLALELAVSQLLDALFVVLPCRLIMLQLNLVRFLGNLPVFLDALVGFVGFIESVDKLLSC